MWHTYTEEFCSAIKKNDVMIPAEKMDAIRIPYGRQSNQGSETHMFSPI